MDAKRFWPCTPIVTPMPSGRTLRAVILMVVPKGVGSPQTMHRQTFQSKQMLGVNERGWVIERC